MGATRRKRFMSSPHVLGAITASILRPLSPSGHTHGTPCPCDRRCRAPRLSPGLARRWGPAALQSFDLPAEEEGGQAFAALPGTHFGSSGRIRTRHGGQELQWKLMNRATLIAAQQNPEAYRGLVVRVAGCSALFTNLNRVVQDEIIARTGHTV